MSLIYAVMNENKIVYIGQTKKSLEERIKNYKRAIRDKNKKTYIINYLRKYFELCDFKVIHMLNEQEDLNELEKKYIKEYNTLYPNGLNLTSGGDSTVFSSETRLKMSLSRIGKEPWNKNTKGVMKAWNKGKKLKAHTQEHKDKRKRFAEENHFYGKSHSDDTKQKISLSKKGSIPPNRVKIYQYDSEMNLVKVFESMTEAINNGYHARGIRKSSEHKTLYKGFYFIKEKNDIR